MNYVKTIESNVKGMEQGKSVELGPKTLIVGPNGAGKSAITNAVELALAAQASDIAGRSEVKSESILLSLAPQGLPPLGAKATLSNGVIALFEIPAGSTSARAKRAKFTGPGIGALPLLEVKEALTGSAEAARAWFLKRLNVSRETVSGLIPKGPPMEAMWKTAVASCNISDAPTTRLLTALSTSKKKAREAGAEARAASKVTSAAAQGLPPPPAEGELEGARQAFKQLEEALAEGQRRQQAVRVAAARVEGRAAAREAATRNAEAFEAAKRERLRLEAALAEAEAALPPEPPALAERLPEADAAITLIRHHFRSGATLCFACNKPLDAQEVVKRAAWLEERLGARKGEEERHQKLRAERAAALEGVNNLRGQLREATRAESRLAELVAPAADLDVDEPLPAAPSETELADLRAELQQARARVEALVAAQAAWATSNKQRDVGLDAVREKQDWAEFAGILQTIVSQLLDAGVQRFVDEVQRWLPQADVFGVELRDGEKEVCRWGLRGAGGHLRTALSGVEWARVTVALALAAAPEGEALRVIIPEDRAWDPQTLARVLEVLAGAPAQVLLASPVVPETIPAGWAVVRVGEGAGAPEAPEAPAPPAPAVPAGNGKRSITL